MNLLHVTQQYDFAFAIVIFCVAVLGAGVIGVMWGDVGASLWFWSCAILLVVVLWRGETFTKPKDGLEGGGMTHEPVIELVFILGGLLILLLILDMWIFGLLGLLQVVNAGVIFTALTITVAAIYYCIGMYREYNDFVDSSSQEDSDHGS